MHKIEKYLEDIKLSIEQINDFVHEIYSFDTFKNNILVKKATERNIEIIGECCKRLLANELELQNAKKIISFRNFIAHEYDKVDDEIVWGILKRHLPMLYLEVLEKLNENKEL